MKNFAIILIFGFCWQASHAVSRFESTKICLIENGFTDDVDDLYLVQAIGDPENADKLKDVSQEKLAAVIACLYEKLYPGHNLNDVLKTLIERNDKLSEEESKNMMETLSICNKNATGDNTKLLSCVNVIASPFDELIAVIRDIPNPDSLCFSNCGVTIGQRYKMEEMKDHAKKFSAYLSIINEQKLSCFMACIIDDIPKNKDNVLKFEAVLSTRIAASTKHNENQKKEMLEILNTCKTQMIKDDEDRTYKFVRCLNIFKDPFALLD